MTEFSFSDAPVDLVDQLRLYVTGVTVKPEGGPPMSFDVNLTDCSAVPGGEDDGNPVDLLSLQDGIVLTLFADQEMTAGSLTLKSAFRANKTCNYLAVSSSSLVKALIC